MFLTFFTELRAAKVPVSFREYLSLLEALDRDLADKSVEEFYYLSRTCLVKDERHFDKFDQVFAHVFKGIESMGRAVDETGIPDEWLRKLAERGAIDPDERVVLLITGDGLKTIDTMRGTFDVAEIAPTVDAFEGAFTGVAA